MNIFRILYFFPLVAFLLLGCDSPLMEDGEKVYDGVQQYTGRVFLDRPNDADNLLKNGSLEHWTFSMTYDILDGWYYHNNYNMREEGHIVDHGKKSARLSSREKGATAIIDQCVSLNSSTKIRIRFRYYVEKWKDKGARLYCYFRTAETEAYTISNDELKDFYDKETLKIIRGGGYGMSYLPATEGEWQTFDYVVDVPPKATHFVFDVRSYFGTTIIVDDCFVTMADDL